MIICLAYSHDEQEQAARLAARIRHLGHCEGHQLVIACEASVTKRFFSDLLATFEDVIEFSFTDRIQHYPETKNLKFQQCALYVANRYKDEKFWLYLEADSVPIRATWANEIEAEVLGSGKLFLGPMVAASQTHRTPAHMGAVAVYPVDLIGAGAGAAMIATELPWPAVIATVTMAAMAESRLICHDWEAQGVPAGCALYHPDRDGKILENLSAPVSAEMKVEVREDKTGAAVESGSSELMQAHALRGADTDSRGAQDSFTPWASRLDSEREILRLVMELKRFCTAPPYTSHVRDVLKAYKVTGGVARGAKILKRRLAMRKTRSKRLRKRLEREAAKAAASLSL